METKNKEEEKQENGEQTEIRISLDKSIVLTILGIIAGVVMIIGCFLPIYTVSFLGISKSIAYISGDGAIVLAFSIVTILLSAMRKLRFASVSIVGMFGLFIYDTIISINMNSEYDIGSYGAGFYILMLGMLLMILAIILAFVWKTDRKDKKTNIIAILLLVLGVALSGVFIGVSAEIEKSSQYEKAINNKKEKNFETAIDSFKELGDYKDSKKQVLVCSYLWAQDCLANGEYESAISLFDGLAGYKDSEQQILECKYQQALEYIENYDYKTAISMFEELADYKDSKEKIEICNYYIIKDSYENGEMTDKEAVKALFEKCNTDESKRYANEIIADGLFEFDSQEDYSGAIKYLKSMEKYTDVSKMIESYRKKKREEEAKRPPEAPCLQEFYDSTDPFAEGDGTMCTAEWNAVADASGYEYLATETTLGVDDAPYCRREFTKETSFTSGASDPICIELKVRAYKIYKGKKIYSDWSNTVYTYLNSEVW